MPNELNAHAQLALPLKALLQQVDKRAPRDYAKLRIAPLPKSGSALSYFELGDPLGTPLLCLHGLAITGLIFEQHHELFAANGIRAIAPCLLGGVYAAEATKTIEDLTTELIELMDALGIHRFDMMGFSWGTLSELAVVCRVPKRVRRAGFMGPMLPVDFLTQEELDLIKSDVHLSLNMAKRTPRLHRGLMWLVCRLPVAALINQFKDANLSNDESKALEPGSAFNKELSRCLDECRRTGSRFFTNGWRTFGDRPGYALSDLAAASGVDLRLFLGERDNVHLPAFAYRIAAACGGSVPTDAMGDEAERKVAGRPGHDVFRHVHSAANCSIWMAPGAGRMACMLYFKEALENLLWSPAEIAL